jgi:hypothetical protein
LAMVAAVKRPPAAAAASMLRREMGSMAFAPVVRWLELWRYAVLHGIGWVSTFFSANFAKNCDKNCNASFSGAFRICTEIVA